MYKGFLVDKGLLESDPHFAQGCSLCHQGDESARTREAAHKGLVKRPSDDLNTCGGCHEEIAGNYKNSLHYTSAGQRHGVMPRFSVKDLKAFDAHVFEKSCRSCHASCGDCHVKSPTIGGVSTGLLKGHSFVRKDEGKTCARCHGGRVYPEFTGEYGGTPDVHYEKGMSCADCHSKGEFHGEGGPYTSRRDVKGRPACINCHPAGQEKKAKAKTAHALHAGKASCTSCHSSGSYRNCYSCHEGPGSTSKPGFFLGRNPRDGKTLTTLRLIPTIKDTFAESGITMDNFDKLPNYWDAYPHNIKKRTNRTRSCNACHVEGKDFLTEEMLIKDGSKANKELIMVPKQLKK